MNDTIIQVKNLVIAFGNFKAVNDISFEVRRGEIFGFLGANGAGKTTTIRTLCGILNPTSGQVFVNGTDVAASISVLKPHIGYMSQKFTLYPDLTVQENMDIAGSLYELSRAQINQRRDELFSFIGLTNVPKGPVRQLSGGTKQMIALAASILHDPELIFLDEPTAGTSPQTRQAFWKLIRRLSSQGKTIFVTTHYMDEAEYCHRIVLMEHGHILATDTPDNLKKTYFPQKPVELTFTQGNQQIISQEMRGLSLGEVSVFGSKLRVNVTDNTAFEKYCQKHRADFTTRTVEPTLDDVFLKAISGAK
jgi:ABC-2 type transport system ATP-binding protein